MKKPKYYLLFIIFCIIFLVNGIFQMIESLPLNPILDVIRYGGVRVNSDKIYISDILPSSPASLTGLSVGDIIVSINGKNVSKNNEVVDIINSNKGIPIDLTVNRNDQILKIKITPRTEYPETEGPIGVELSNIETKKQSLITLIPKLLIKNAVWDTPVQDLISKVLSLNYFRIKDFILGFIQLIFAIGLIRLKKWALYGTFLLYIIGLISIILSLFKPHKVNGEIFLVIALIIYFCILIYLFKQRKFFS